jgi:hypothetical protein
LLLKLLDTIRDKRRRKTLLFSLYQRVDARKTDPASDPVAPVDCSSRLAGIEQMHVKPISKRFIQRFEAGDVEQIRSKNLDVLIRFGFNILHGDILTAARYGVWSFHHGDNDYYRGGPPYFWEIVERHPLCGVILQVLTEELDAGKVLCKGIFATSQSLWYGQNRVQPYWGASTFIIQKLRELHVAGWPSLEKNAVPTARYLGKKKIYRTPTNAEMVKWMAPELVRRSFRAITRRPVIPHWRMAIRTGKSILSENAEARGFRWMESPRGHFYADPFLVQEADQTWLFFEDLDYASRLGRISVAEIKNGALGSVHLVLERPYHLSYPCVFRYGGEWFMIPETGSQKRVELYRCTRFPYDWEFDRELWKGTAVDTTVWVEDGICWFFVTLKEPRGGAVQLWLFHADGPRKPWIPHPANPISTDIRSSRGGGAVFARDGKRYRPSQDCSISYGRSFSLNEIVTLTPEEYHEERRVTVDPTWAPGLIGTHSYSQARDIEVIDGCALLPPALVR